MFYRELRSTAERFVPLPLDDGVVKALPGQLRDHLVSYIDERTGKDGGKAMYALYIYGRKDLWKPENLEGFVREVEAKTPGDVLLTGIAGNLFHSTQAIYRSFLMATVYAIVLIFFLVLIDLRRLSETLLAISVLVMGLPMLLLVMWVWRKMGEPHQIPGSWNLANFFALPILIGAGHEYGVFMVHRYREVLHDPRRVWQKWDVSDRALLLCAIVTTCSFGFLIRADHRGLASLGWVMAVGSGCIYLATILVLRPILQWRLRGRATESRSHEGHEDFHHRVSEVRRRTETKKNGHG